eukprot:m.319164 g.319164  ORF g.319164 m.319164 type:complete len:572 (-) comp20298_c0_seq2:277-1992(-)
MAGFARSHPSSVLTLSLCALVAALTVRNTCGTIIQFPEQKSKAIMKYSETLLKRENDQDTRPFIEFQVECSTETWVSWVILAAPSEAIEVHNVTISGTSSTFQTALCSPHEGLDGNYLNITLSGSHCDFSEHLTDNAGNDYEYCCDNSSGLVLNNKYVKYYIDGGRFQCDPDVEAGLKKVKALAFTGHYVVYIESEPEGFGEHVALAPGKPIWGYITFMNVHGMLSAMVYPQMVFYGSMGLFYMFVGIAWIVLMAVNYHDLLQLQFWLCAVIGIGMIEFAFAYGNLDYMNKHGSRSAFLFYTTQILHALKSTVARILVLVVAMGYGVVKPRLGAAYKQVLVFGILYFVFAAMYSITHNADQTQNESKTAMMAAIPLSVLDAMVLWWIFFTLHHTMKILELRQNRVKLLLYQRFRLLLTFFAIGAIVFFGWTLYNSWDTATNHAWENYWLVESFLHVLFTIVLLGILVLWRPTMNNSRYAYAALETDLLDDDDENSFEQVQPNYSLDMMKSRTLSSRGHKAPEPREDVEDALQWVEENIPMTAMSNDNTMGSFPMDSDEEIMNTRYELSKME